MLKKNITSHSHYGSSMKSTVKTIHVNQMRVVSKPPGTVNCMLAALQFTTVEYFKTSAVFSICALECSTVTLLKLHLLLISGTNRSKHLVICFKMTSTAGKAKCPTKHHPFCTCKIRIWWKSESYRRFDATSAETTNKTAGQYIKTNFNSIKHLHLNVSTN